MIIGNLQALTDIVLPNKVDKEKCSIQVQTVKCSRLRIAFAAYINLIQGK